MAVGTRVMGQKEEDVEGERRVRNETRKASNGAEKILRRKASKSGGACGTSEFHYLPTVGQARFGLQDSERFPILH